MFIPANLQAWYRRKKSNTTKASNTGIKLSTLR